MWWVKVAVPSKFREQFGFDLRKSTGEKDLDKALLMRDSIVSDLKSKFLDPKVEDKPAKDFLKKIKHTFRVFK